MHICCGDIGGSLEFHLYPHLLFQISRERFGEGLSTFLGEPGLSSPEVQHAVLRHAGRVQPPQRRLAGLVCREEALDAQLVQRNVVRRP